ncbi:sarcosine oxidase subunit delta [Brucella sp. NBRC 12950]|uniref:sarcosine oxidase subunit delta n=1 Tax=Brucella sp. NBRC 12950 TaxID=2994518 RepID=UPI0024A2769B|nr:sarcosine oxidase subunit delta [Brucella sp. NBRC 12950]GLU29129.1 sarcosine oxidase subunit delta [Brucella sp. NBRC 12950]
MQLFPCPFCGPRSESEFHYGGDAFTHRPEGFREVSDAEWSAYLHDRKNLRGAANEVWMHMTCGEVFRLERDTVHHAVARSVALMDGEQQ